MSSRVSAPRTDRRGRGGGFGRARWSRTGDAPSRRIAFAALFAVFDFAEFAHQRDVARTGLAAVALILVLVHLATAALASRESISRQAVTDR
jgi:hypothetical protein